MSDQLRSQNEQLLIVDDDPASRDMLRRRFGRLGFRVTDVPDGRKALQLIGRSNFDLILLDVQMPELDGLAVLQAIRQNFPATSLPVIMITAMDQSQDIVDALQLGANDYIVKPLNFDVVLARVQTQLSLNRTSHLLGVFNAQFHDCLQHFFPGSEIRPVEDSDPVRWRERLPHANYRMGEILGTPKLGIEWLRVRYCFTPCQGSLTLAGRRLLDVLMQVLDTRFRAMFDLEMPNRLELVHYAIEDWVVAEYSWPNNVLSVLEGLKLLRLAALLTYENRRISTGILFTNSSLSHSAESLPSSTRRLGGWLFQDKSLQRLCDGLHMVFVVDHHGNLRGVTAIEQWLREHGSNRSLPGPCSRTYIQHAQATNGGNSLCMILTPAHDIKIFVHGVLMFGFRGARWHQPDLPAKFSNYCKSMGTTYCAGLSDQIFQAALNLAESRHGALFVVLDDPETSLSQLVSTEDRQAGQCTRVVAGSRMLEQVLQMTLAGEVATCIGPRLLEALATIDGAIVMNKSGAILAAGAILRVAMDAEKGKPTYEGARSTAAVVASRFGSVLKVSEDGVVTLFRDGQLLWSF